MIICALPANTKTKIPGWKEYRLDFLKNLNYFNSVVDKKTILTLRAVAEGGVNYFPQLQKQDFYRKMITKHGCLVDWEIQEFSAKIDIPAANLILSYHNFQKFDFERVAGVIAKANKFSAKFIKLAVPIGTYQHLAQVSDLIAISNKPVIWAGLGELGKLSRILYKFLGANATFCGMQTSPTAPGQLTCQEAKKYRLAKLTDKTAVGGIIGGKQVENSLGLDFYNNYFKKHKLAAVYAPFPTEDLADFWQWLQSNQTGLFFGFSVTMPFKEQLAQKLGCNRPINLYLPASNTTANTDIIAFEQALNYLEITNEDKILLWGYGGTAAAFVKVAKKFSNNIFVTGRDQTKLQNFIAKYHLNTAGKEPDSKYDLLVNCTPIGTVQFPIDKKLIPNFTKLLDLPYQDRTTELVKFCQQNSLVYLSGRKFWQWQAEDQLKAFLEELKGRA